jgi:hypothetical protein
MEERMAQFNNVNDFVGSYSGSYDGRQAEVTIEAGAQGVVSFNTLFTVTFTDLDRHEQYQGIATVPEGVIDTHIFSDFTLNRVGGSGSVYWSRLYLHTWDTSYMSGVSVWDNIEFGMSFRRD